MKVTEPRRFVWSITAMLAIMLGVSLFVGSAFASLPTKQVQGKSSNAPSGGDTATATLTATLTLTATETSTGTPSVEPSATLTSTATVTSTATLTATLTATVQPSATLTSTATMTATSTVTSTATLTATSTVTSTSTAVASATTTPSRTATVAASATRTATSIGTATQTRTATVVASQTPGNGRVAICHRTGSERNPWVQIEVSENALPAHQRHGDIYPVPANGCPGPGTATPTMSITPEATATMEACDTEFSDVPPGHTFHPFVRCLACQHILGGYSDGSYRYGNPVTRGQIAKIVANAAGFRDPVSGQTYSDIPPTETFYLFIERLSKRGVVGGYQDGTFRSDALTTRGQAAKMVSNTFFPICNPPKD